MRANKQGGFTLVEITVTVVIIMIVAGAFFTLFVALINSTVVAKRQAVALTLATNQMEYLKSLPYDSLAVAGGSIYSSSPLPATTTKQQGGFTYTVTTSIKYVDDAYDGCASYPTQALKELYCRNYPPPSGAPSVDQNPADYKIAHVAVTDSKGDNLASVDTEISARVSETASTTGALFVSVLDPSGTPVSGATVTATDGTISPNVNVSDTTDSNGVVIFYNLPPDSGTDYVITASKTGYSSLTTINASGSLQPTYPNQKILTQQSSYVTLTLAQQGADSLLIQAADTNGNPLAGAHLYVKGGYKKYTTDTDYSYYFDNSSVVADSAGYATLQNLPPVDQYLFCNSDATTDTASPSSTTNCSVGGTKYYLAAAVPYGGNNSLSPVAVPVYDPTNPPTTTFSYGDTAYLQEVQLLLSSNANSPRVYTMTPDNLSLAAGGLGSFQLAIGGYNLTNASATLSLGGNTYSGTGCSSSTTQLTCTFNLTSITTGTAQLSVSNASGTLTLPYSPQLGGFNVKP